MIVPDPGGLHILISLDTANQLHVQPFNFDDKQQAIILIRQALEALILDAEPIPEKLQ